MLKDKTVQRNLGQFLCFIDSKYSLEVLEGPSLLFHTNTLEPADTERPKDSMLPFAESNYSTKKLKYLPLPLQLHPGCKT